MATGFTSLNQYSDRDSVSEDCNNQDRNEKDPYDDNEDIQYCPFCNHDLNE